MAHVRHAVRLLASAALLLCPGCASWRAEPDASSRNRGGDGDDLVTFGLKSAMRHMSDASQNGWNFNSKVDTPRDDGVFP